MNYGLSLLFAARLHNHKGMGRNYVYRDSRNDLKSFTASDFLQPIIDLEPSTGESGGHILAQDPPEEIAKNPTSTTGKYLKTLLIPN